MIRFIRITLLLSIFSLFNFANANQYGGKFLPFVDKTAIYTLSKESEAGLLNLKNEIYREIGSDVNKKVTLFYGERQKKMAMSLRRSLIKQGLSTKNIRLVYKKRTIYPVYAKVHSIVKQKTKCSKVRMDTVFYEKQGSCAVESNIRIQSKN
ncbi:MULTISPECIES: hypothetical protein [Pasteurellaceae]|uniref:Uncharacterized protein n=1 Tax=Pasteurella atlantica TaxID=2827233 RepID=A0AAW8CQF3_9PAST|nr:hypothetical protein [Pasteurella atlantica]MBR0573544.1 hypothetical protein [Pasteurella atlantica]MDP8039597.1 hypothetical protein [Pasteurella atlantica]MDP8041688.1 hypothetical protein [Pasteurella atlantica]MDP8043823.1 hypothetical protein [Pasteurella atlantica]MDP8045909.1 hypothetical protein [Pasteurella atlantica]